VIALGTAFWGMRRRIELSADGIDSTLVLFGVPLGKPARLGPTPAPVYAVSPDEGSVRHVLIAAPSGPASLVADRESAERLVSRATQSAASERAPMGASVGAPAAELPLATSARYRGPDRPARLRS
jgi:hypothetical protein